MYIGGQARSLWPRDNTTTGVLTLKTFRGIFYQFVSGLLQIRQLMHYFIKNQSLTQAWPDQNLLLKILQ